MRFKLATRTRQLMAKNVDGVAALLIFGSGYTGMRVARRAIDLGFDAVYATAHTAEHFEDIFSHGIEPVLFDGERPIWATCDTPFLPHITHVLSTLPPRQGRDPVLAAHPDLTANLPALRWAGYLSSVDVYGGSTGEWVDESTVAQPPTQLGRVRRLCENEWAAVQPVPTHIFRAGRIYGPHCGALEAVRSGAAVRIRSDGFVRPCVHVDDVAQLILHSMAAAAATPDAAQPGEDPPGMATPATGHPPAGASSVTYCNLVDEHPSSPADELAFAAELFGLPPPAEASFEDMAPKMSVSARQFWTQPIRARSAWRVAQGVPLLYPTFREGLRAALEEETGHRGGAGGSMAGVGGVDADAPARVSGSGEDGAGVGAGAGGVIDRMGRASADAAVAGPALQAAELVAESHTLSVSGPATGSFTEETRLSPEQRGERGGAGGESADGMDEIVLKRLRALAAPEPAQLPLEVVPTAALMGGTALSAGLTLTGGASRAAGVSDEAAARLLGAVAPGWTVRGGGALARPADAHVSLALDRWARYADAPPAGVCLPLPQAVLSLQMEAGGKLEGELVLRDGEPISVRTLEWVALLQRQIQQLGG
jgi:nucleoside-diphosphate-sugar epimerase